MTATRLDGVAAASAIKEELRVRVAALAEAGNVPGLGTLLVDDLQRGLDDVVGAQAWPTDATDLGVRMVCRAHPGNYGLP